MICKICKINYKNGFSDKKLICSNCRSKITKELQNKLDNNNYNDIEIIYKETNFYGINYSNVIYKDLNFDIYQCTTCNDWFVCFDHPKRVKDNFPNLKNISCCKSCQVKKQHQTIKFKYKCKNCNNEIENPGSICKYCGFNHTLDFSYKCLKCGCKIYSALSECPNCGYSNARNGFNRQEFYSQKLNIVKFNSMDSYVTLDDFNLFKNKLGVWSRWNDSGECLDVCKSKDIGSEMLSSLRSFDSLANNPNQSLNEGWIKKYKKQLDDCNGKPIIFKIVAICKTEEEALKIEAQYAHDNKAKYWSPEPGQKLF